MDLFHYAALLAFMSIAIEHTCHCRRLKRSNSENFDVLLNLFKVKPLVGSKVFKTFKHSMLMKSGEKQGNFDSGEFFELNALSNNGRVERPIIQEELEDEPIRVNISPPQYPVMEQAYFNPVSKPENFINDPLFAIENGDQYANEMERFQGHGIVTRQHSKNYLSDAETFMPNSTLPLSGDEMRRYFQNSMLSNGDEKITEFVDNKAPRDNAELILGL